jgi:hypothetical protein
MARIEHPRHAVGSVVTVCTAPLELTIRDWLDSLLADEVIRRSAFQPWECIQWDSAWYEEWITTFLRQPEDF